MHRCSDSHGNSVSPCFCGWFPAATQQPYLIDDHDQVDDVSSSSPSNSVDCTLSLGTPSTRQIHDNSSTTIINNNRSRPASCVSNLCWDIFQSNDSKPSAFKRGSTSNTSILNNNNNMSSGEPLLARRCANCDTTSTPLWRNGPRGPKSLCNACGIRYKKEERRATSNATAAAAHSWGAAHGAQTTQRVGINEFRFMEEEDRSSDAGVPNFLPWHLNVPDRHSGLVHDYT